MSASGAYPSHPRATVNRLRKRAAYDYSTIHTIIDSASVVHVSFPPDPTSDDPFPAILPMIGCTGDYSKFGTDPSSESEASNDYAKDLYLHGYVSTRMQRLSVNATGEAEGMPMSICASHVDGIVLALAPFHNSMNYRSAVIHGYAVPVTDPEERMYALARVTDSVLKGRWEASRNPPTAVENKTTGILKVSIVDASAKVRTGGPSDDRADMKNDELRKNTWVGVVPVFEAYGEPIAADYNNVGKPPAHVTDAVEAANTGNLARAKKAILST